MLESLARMSKVLTPLLALILAGCGARPGGLERGAGLQQAAYSGSHNTAFALEFPAGWGHIVTDGGIMLSNSPGLLDSANDVVFVPDGALAADVTALRREQARELGARNAADLLDSYIFEAGAAGGARGYSRAQPIRIDGREGAQSIAKGDDSDNLVLALALEDTYALGIFVAPAGELALHIESLKAIIASARLINGR